MYTNSKKAAKDLIESIFIEHEFDDSSTIKQNEEIIDLAAELIVEALGTKINERCFNEKKYAVRIVTDHGEMFLGKLIPMTSLPTSSEEVYAIVDRTLANSIDDAYLFDASGFDDADEFVDNIRLQLRAALGCQSLLLPGMCVEDEFIQDMRDILADNPATHIAGLADVREIIEYLARIQEFRNNFVDSNFCLIAPEYFDDFRRKESSQESYRKAREEYDKTAKHVDGVDGVVDATEDEEQLLDLIKTIVEAENQEFKPESYNIVVTFNAYSDEELYLTDLRPQPIMTSIDAIEFMSKILSHDRDEALKFVVIDSHDQVEQQIANAIANLIDVSEAVSQTIAKWGKEVQEHLNNAKFKLVPIE